MVTDLDKLQGTWHITALESGGKKIPAPVDATVVLEGRRFKSLGMGAPFEGTVEIDETKKPKTLDLVFSAGHAKGTRNVGIYRIDKDGWTLCLATEGTKRPVKFETRAGSPFALETLKRSPATARQPASRRPGNPAPDTKSSGRRPSSRASGRWSRPCSTRRWTRAWWRGANASHGNVTSVVAGPKVMLKAASRSIRRRRRTRSTTSTCGRTRESRRRNLRAEKRHAADLHGRPAIPGRGVQSKKGTAGRSPPGDRRPPDARSTTAACRRVPVPPGCRGPA